MGSGVIRVLMVVAVALAATAGAADAATFCVRPGGADGCYATIKAAVAACAANDTVAVYPGEYLESDTVSKAGIVIMAIGAPCEVKLLPPIGDGFNVVPGATNAVVQGFTIEAITGWGIYSQGVNFHVRNCVIRNCAYSGIVLAASGARHIHNCVIADNTNYGIECTAGSVFVENCIVVDNGAYGIAETYVGAIASEYSDVWNNVSGSYYGNVTHPHDISEDPLFFDANCYHLQANSSCIDTGDPATSFFDCDGTRNDMGVYGGRYAWCGPGPVVTSLQLVPATVVKGETFRIDAVGAAR